MTIMTERFSISRADFRQYMFDKFQFAAALDEKPETLSNKEYALYFKPKGVTQRLREKLGKGDVSQDHFLKAVEDTMVERTLSKGRNPDEITAIDILDFFSGSDEYTFNKIFHELVERYELPELSDTKMLAKL